MDWLLYYTIQQLFMVFINYHIVYCGALCSDPLKVPYRKAELTLCALGSVSAQPINNTIIHFRDHFALIEHVCYIQFCQRL